MKPAVSKKVGIIAVAIVLVVGATLFYFYRENSLKSAHIQFATEHSPAFPGSEITNIEYQRGDHFDNPPKVILTYTLAESVNREDIALFLKTELSNNGWESAETRLAREFGFEIKNDNELDIGWWTLRRENNPELVDFKAVSFGAAMIATTAYQVAMIF